MDIVQVIQHKPFSMMPHECDEHIDFVVFSAHKCYSPLNGGALVGPKNSLKNLILYYMAQVLPNL